MKNLFIFSIVFVFCYIGYLIKNKYKKQKVYLETIKDFLEYFKSNMFDCKNNIVEIINSYKLLQKNKNAITEDIFENTEQIFKFNNKFAEIYVFDECLLNIINKYFTDIGSQCYVFENEKLDSFLKILSNYIEKTNLEIKTKGDLLFKIFISLGLILAIVLW